MRRLLYVVACLACFMLSAVPVYAEEWTVYAPGIEKLEESPYVRIDIPVMADIDHYLDMELLDKATSSDADKATPSDGLSADIFVSLDSMSADMAVSDMVVGYMSDAFSKIGLLPYVMYRVDKYTYRMVYSNDLVYDIGSFSAPVVDYISYNSLSGIWNSGFEDDFSLVTNGYVVYSNFGNYPQLYSKDPYIVAILFLGILYFLFMILRSFFNSGKMSM